MKKITELAKTLGFGMLLICLTAMVSCTDNSTEDIEPKTPDAPNMQDLVYRVIYDTDLGSSTDDLFALKLLYYIDDLGFIKLIGGVVSREENGNWEKYIKMTDVLNTYYGYGSLPMGVDRDGVKSAKPFIDYAGIADLKNPDGSSMFKRSITDYNALPDAHKLYRKLLSEHPDGATKICSLGFMTVLAKLLQSEGDEYSPLNGVELVKKKVHSLYLMAGKFGEEGNDSPGYNFGSHNPDALEFTRTMLKLWPESVPIYVSPSPVGDELEYPKDEVLQDIYWTDTEPIKQTYMNCDVNTGQMMWDFLTALNTCLYTTETLFEFSESGFMVLTDDNRLLFEPSPMGNCYYQMLNGNRKETLLTTYKSFLRLIASYHR